MLARILVERGLFKTPIGSMALACAAFDDVAAWTLLAVVVAFVTTGGALATVATTVLLTAVFVAVIILIVRPLARPWLASGAADDKAGADIHDRLEGFSSVLLLPLFFAFTGLRTDIALIDNTASIVMCAGIIALAVIGTFGGTAISARLTGMTWTDSLVLGTLMNTRGLMELIVLNVGYDLGVIPAEMFTALVIMALVTTMMTGPVIDVLSRRRSEK